MKNAVTKDQSFTELKLADAKQVTGGSNTTTGTVKGHESNPVTLPDHSTTFSETVTGKVK